MGSGRVEAFSDGVFAVILTIMVLELKVPAGGNLAALKPLAPTLLAYVLSFLYVGIYWSNHHHMFQVAERVNGRVLLSNLFLLFWVSLIPISTAWMGEYYDTFTPTAVYGALLLLSGIGYVVLQQSLIAAQAEDRRLATAVGSDGKGKASVALYVLAIGLASLRPRLAQLIYLCVALLWLIPDRRIERLDRPDNP